LILASRLHYALTIRYIHFFNIRVSTLSSAHRYWFVRKRFAHSKHIIQYLILYLVLKHCIPISHKFCLITSNHFWFCFLQFIQLLYFTHNYSQFLLFCPFFVFILQIIQSLYITRFFRKGFILCKYFYIILDFVIKNFSWAL
jgi:hypothetical protein